jgi:molybdate transport system substrate-binding protein
MAAREAMQNAKVWDVLQPRLVFGENIQQTLQYAQSGNADAAIVAQSLAIGSGGSYTLVPEKLYTPLKQALAVLKASSQPDAARRFAAFLSDREGRAVLKKYGFTF